MAEMGIGEIKHGNIKDQIEQSMFKNTRENKVEFVLCAGGGAGKLHIRKNRTTCWCGRQWTQVVDGSPDIDRCRKGDGTKKSTRLVLKGSEETSVQDVYWGGLSRLGQVPSSGSWGAPR